MSKKDLKSAKRRDFLRKAGLGAGAAGVAAATLSSTKAEAAVDQGATRSGYRETEHVKKFYELARF